MANKDRLTIEELRALEEQVARQPADGRGVMLFQKDGILTIIRSAIAAETALARR